MEPPRGPPCMKIFPRARRPGGRSPTLAPSYTLPRRADGACLYRKGRIIVALWTEAHGSAPGDTDRRHPRRSVAALLLPLPEGSGGGAVDDVAVRGVESGAVAGTVPRALERVEAHNAAEVRADG